MRVMRYLKRILFATAALLLPCAAADTYACQCREPEPPCSAYRDADAVFIGAVSEIVRAEMDQIETISFNVERGFHGVDGGKATLVDHLTSCSYNFKEGLTYLVYAYRDSTTGKLSTYACSRTRTISAASADLSYIAAAAKSPNATLITGILADRAKTLNRVTVTAERLRKKYRSSSDQNGWFKLAVAEPGEYKVRIFLPPDVGVGGAHFLLDKISGTMKTKNHYIVEYLVQVRPGGCTFIDMPLMIFHYSGKVGKGL